MRDSSKKNIILFYSAKAFQMLFPLLTTTIIARNMRKEEFAYVILVQSIAIFCGSIIEYGFNYSGARLLSENRGNQIEIARIFHGINLAKTILLSASVLFLFVIAYYSRLPIIYWSGAFLLVISQGYNLLWYFQGVDRVLIGVAADLIGKAVFLAFVFIKSSNGVLFVNILGFIQLAVIAILFLYINRSHKAALDVRYSWKLIIDSFSLFVFRAGALIYSGGSIAILGLVVAPAALADYAGADRLFRAAAGLTAPIGDAFFANISGALAVSPERAERLFRSASKIMIAVSLFIFLVGEAISEPLVNFVLGDKYSGSTPILRTLLITIPFIGWGTVFFVLYLMPRKQDVAFALATTLAGVWVLLSAYLLIPRFGVGFMAWSIVISEIIICSVGLVSINRYRKRIEVRRYE